MEQHDYNALRAKVRVANDYIEQVLKHRGKYDLYDILKVVTPSMRPKVEIVTPEQASADGLGIVRIRQEIVA